jgi:hypothetical protein
MTVSRWALVALFGTACGGGYTIEFTQKPCEDVALDDPGPTELLFEADGEDLVVWRSASFAGADDVFAPEVEVDTPAFGPPEVFVYEAWTAGASDGELCFFPGLILYEAAGDKVVVEWYDPGESVPEVRETYEG